MVLLHRHGHHVLVLFSPMPMLPKSLCCLCDYGGYMCIVPGAFMPIKGAYGTLDDYRFYMPMSLCYFCDWCLHAFGA